MIELNPTNVAITKEPEPENREFATLAEALFKARIGETIYLIGQRDRNHKLKENMILTRTSDGWVYLPINH